MDKIRIRKFDYIIWLIVAVLGALCYFTHNIIFLLLTYPFLLLYFIVWVLRFILYFFGRSKQIPSSEIHLQKTDTSGWIKSKGKIMQVLPNDEVVENGKIIARFMSFKIQLEKYEDISMVHEVFISRVLVPISNLNEIGINKEVQVLVHPQKKFTAVFDSNIEKWIKIV